MKSKSIKYWINRYSEMCRKVECQSCNKHTWAGCGKHIEQILKDIPIEERCKCKEEITQQTKNE